MPGEVIVTRDALRAWTDALFRAVGLRDDAAGIVAESLVDASLRGVDSHGVLRVPVYLERLRSGLMNADPTPRVEREHGGVALVDGDHGPGQVAGLFACDHAVELAERHGVAAVSVRRSSHYGAAGYYTARAARAGLVALSTTNAEPMVVPHGGADWALGTNPIAVAAPTSRGVWVLDMATSQVAMGKIFLARERGRELPEGWGVDARGAPTTDPRQVESAVPLGGYKGYGLALMVEVLSGVLAGSGLRHEVGRMYDDWDRPQDVGHFFLVLDPERTIGRERFAALLDGLLADLRAIRPAPGYDEVLVAGDPEERVQERRTREGIPLPASLHATFEELSRELGVELPG